MKVISAPAIAVVRLASGAERKVETTVWKNEETGQVTFPALLEHVGEPFSLVSISSDLFSGTTSSGKEVVFDPAAHQTRPC